MIEVNLYESSGDSYPLVSIVIPNYNHTRFLDHAIQSALDQKYPNKEIIVVDDGSTDNCREVVASYCNQVRYLWQENRGLAGARNTGIRASNGGLIGFLDADDQWMPDYLEQMVALASEHPQAAVCYCQTKCMDINGDDLPQVLGGPPIEPKDIYWKLIRSNFIIPSTVLLRRSSITEAGLFDEMLRSCEDWDLWLRILPGAEIIGSSQCLVRYRIHGSSLSTNIEGMHAAARSVIEKHFGEDDQQYESWSEEKRRAYGGLYWYYAWTSLTRKGDWELAGSNLWKAMMADPSLATDLDFFFELALGDQPTGYRGSAHNLDLRSNVSQLEFILHTGTNLGLEFDAGLARSEVISTAYFAFGILAYNTNQYELCRMYLARAVNKRRDLIFNQRLRKLFFRSLFGAETIARLRKLREGMKLVKQ